MDLRSLAPRKSTCLVLCRRRSNQNPKPLSTRPVAQITAMYRTAGQLTPHPFIHFCIPRPCRAKYICMHCVFILAPRDNLTAFSQSTGLRKRLQLRFLRCRLPCKFPLIRTNSERTRLIRRGNSTREGFLHALAAGLSLVSCDTQWASLLVGLCYVGRCVLVPSHHICRAGAWSAVVFCLPDMKVKDIMRRITQYL